MILVSGLKGRYCIQDLRERFIEKMEKQLTNFIFVLPLQCEGSPHENVATSIWALPVWGGGLDPCQDGLGHLFREELSKFKWAFA